MAERITNLEPASGAPAKYPWAEWADGSAWRITRGEDFHVSPTSIASLIRSHAKRHGLSVYTRITGVDVVEFRFFDELEQAA